MGVSGYTVAFLLWLNPSLLDSKVQDISCVLGSHICRRLSSWHSSLSPPFDGSRLSHLQTLFKHIVHRDEALVTLAFGEIRCRARKACVLARNYWRSQPLRLE